MRRIDKLMERSEQLSMLVHNIMYSDAITDKAKAIKVLFGEFLEIVKTGTVAAAQAAERGWLLEIE